jgi:hypothetical protein
MCLGLSTAYIHRFGWEADILHPLIGPSISGLAGSESIDAIRQPEP